LEQEMKTSYWPTFCS